MPASPKESGGKRTEKVTGTDGPGSRSIRREIRAAIDATYLGQLGPISLVIAGYYSLIAVAHHFLLDPAIRTPMIVMALSTAALGLLTALLVWRGVVKPAYSHLALVPEALASTANVYLHVYLSGQQLQLTNSLLMTIAFGIITLSPTVFGGLILVGAVGFIGLLAVTPGAYTVHVCFLFGGGLVLSTLAFTQRYRTLWNAQRLLISNREKAAILSQMNEAVKRQMHEARDAAEAARRANEAKDIFLANTSHELRTPLTGVLGMLDLLAPSNLDADQREALDAAQFSARTLLAVINDILDLAKLDAGKIELSAQAFSPQELVRRVAGLLAPRAEEKGVELVLTLPETDSRYLLGDPVRIGQILFNFLSNAVKFTDKGRVEVRMELREEGGEGRLLLEVSDTGIGFDMAETDQLFDRFHQLDSGADRRHAGTGLGLAICKELAALMHGEIRVDSAPGKGSTFSLTLTLPWAAGAAGQAEQQARAGDSRLYGASVRVLVAEDNPVNQMLIRKLLEPYGWQLTLVGNGAEAVAVVQAGGPYDLILMDVRMPVMDGVAATRAIRALEGAAGKTPIIALTANTMAADAEAYVAAGMDRVVGKPVQIEELAAAMASLLFDAARPT